VISHIGYDDGCIIMRFKESEESAERKTRLRQHRYLDAKDRKSVDERGQNLQSALVP
jgi:hypothetical protein